MKLKEYATKIKNRLVGQRAKPQEEEKDDLQEKIAERTQELIAEDRQEAVRAAVVEEPEPEETTEQPKAERNISADVMKLAAVTRGLKTAFEQVGKAITEAFRKAKWTELQLRKELISNNRRKMKGMPMIRAKALEKARKNKRRKPEK